MAEHLRILRHVGWVLVVIGLLDIGFMIYCIANRMNYSSSLNVFSVVAGIFLLRGSLGAARVVTWFSAFMLSGLLLCSFLVFPWLQPLEYWVLTFREDPVVSLVSILMVPVLLFVLFWVYRMLRAPPVVQARAAAGQRSGVPKSAFVAGSALAVIMAVMLQLTLKGELADQAVRLATQQHGSEYRYFVSSINWAGRRASARLTAYNDKESKEVEVEWEN